MQQSPGNALLITHTDAHTFTLWYYQQVEKQRPDLAVIDARLAGYAWSDAMLQAQDTTLARVDFDPEATWPDRLHAANSHRPLCDLDATTAQLQCP